MPFVFCCMFSHVIDTIWIGNKFFCRSYLKIEFKDTVSYPFVDTDGWLVDRSEEGTTVLEVDPDSQHHCPGEWVYEV